MNAGKCVNRRSFLGTLSALSVFPSPWVRRAGAGELRRLTFLLDVAPYGKHALFYPALRKGFFREAGLDVTFQPGKGSADVVTKVASGAADAGFADAATSILARGKGVPLKQVMMVHYKAMNNCITMASHAVRKPTDMVGKKFGATVGDAPRIALPALAAINGFDPAKVEILTVESPAKPAVFAARQVDGLLSLDAYTPVMAAAAKKVGEEAVEMSFADWGLDMYSNGIVISDDRLRQDPQTSRALVDAFAKSCVYAIENREEALGMFLKENPAANADIARAQFDVAISHLLVDEVKDHGVGPIDQAKMAFSLDIVRKYFGLEGTVKLDEIYSNDFVTAGQKPKGV